MLFCEEYSDLNSEIKVIEKPRAEDFDIDIEDVKEVYEKRNLECLKTDKSSSFQNKKNKYQGLYFFAGFTLIVGVGGIIAGDRISTIGGIIALVVSIILFAFGWLVHTEYKNDVLNANNSYKQLNSYNENMERFIKLNDEYNDKTFNVRKPYIIEMAEEIKKYSYLEMKNAIITHYRHLGYKIESLGVRKWGGVLLKATSSNGENRFGILIFPYNNPISGYALNGLYNMKQEEYDVLEVYTKFGRYKPDYSGVPDPFFPIEVYDSFSLAEEIWKSNTIFYNAMKKKQEKQKHTFTTEELLDAIFKGKGESKLSDDDIDDFFNED